jgi:hypothetical protein
MWELAACAAVIGALIAGSIYFPHRSRKRRRLGMQALADRLGWSFQAAPPLDVVRGHTELELFTTGHRQAIRNHLSGRRGEHAVSVFDFSYVTGDGDLSTVWQQTVVQVQSPGVWLPVFVLRPEHLLHRIDGLLGSPDIDIEADPGFSRHYLLRGFDKPAIRARFDAEVRGFYERHPGSSTEARGSDLFLWYGSGWLRLDEVEVFVDRAIHLAGLLGRRGAIRRTPRVP